MACGFLNVLQALHSLGAYADLDDLLSLPSASIRPRLEGEMLENNLTIFSPPSALPESWNKYQYFIFYVLKHILQDDGI